MFKEGRSEVEWNTWSSEELSILKISDDNGKLERACRGSEGALRNRFKEENLRIGLDK